MLSLEALIIRKVKVDNSKKKITITDSIYEPLYEDHCTD